MADEIYNNEEENDQPNLSEMSPFSSSLKFYHNIANEFSGYIQDLKKNHAKTALKVGINMRYDDDGLAHSSFVFLAADYAAQAAVNLPYLVTVSSRVSFYAPVKIGDVVEFEANAFFEESKKREVKVVGKIKEIKVFEGNFQIVVLEDHILTLQKKALEAQENKRKGIKTDE